MKNEALDRVNIELRDIINKIKRGEINSLNDVANQLEEACNKIGKEE